MKPLVTLAIEAAIGGGSLALLRDGEILEKWHSCDNIARSEELLTRISEIIPRAGIDTRDLTRIAVSRGPGSYTGIRIGLATAMGLARSLSLPCTGVSSLTAIALSLGRSSRNVLVIVPIGRGGYCWQTFEDAVPNETANTGHIDDLISGISVEPTLRIYAHQEAYSSIASIEHFAAIGDRLIDVGKDIAAAIGAASLMIDEGLEPFYAHDSLPKRAGGRA